MKSPSRIWKDLSWKSVGQWCKKAAVRSGIFLMYVLGVYLAAMAWLYEPLHKIAALRVGATLAGIAVFAAAWYLGTWVHKEPAPAPARPPARQAPRRRPKGKKR